MGSWLSTFSQYGRLLITSQTSDKVNDSWAYRDSDTCFHYWCDHIFYSSTHTYGTHVNILNTRQPHIHMPHSAHTRTHVIIPVTPNSLTYLWITQHTHGTHVNAYNTQQPEIYMPHPAHTNGTHDNTKNSLQLHVHLTHPPHSMGHVLINKIIYSVTYI